jgi:hypothetical protein
MRSIIESATGWARSLDERLELFQRVLEETG